MFVPISWLKDYIKLETDIKDFTDRMTLSGTKTEGFSYRGEEICNVVTGKVVGIEAHPDSDHMYVCKIDDGERIRTIVTGAQNVTLNDIVPVAKDGSVITGGKKITTSKLRGVMSEGMLCSASELGIDNKIAPKFAQDGIYILPADTVVGKDIKEILGLNDYVVEFELTNNRQDCNSVLGIACEADATLGHKFQYPEYEYSSEGNEIKKYLSIYIENYQQCRRYTARMVKIKKIESSPMWMQTRLMAAGVRPINNVVDVSNFVMLETGQPLHTFDYGKLAGGKIIVKNAKDGDSVTTLDGVERKLDHDVLMIYDGEKQIAIAGIMGGGNSDIDEKTEFVVIESANFDKNSVRRSSKFLGLRSESSAHFEKGISIFLTKYAADRAASLLVEIGAAEYIDGLIDQYEQLDPIVKLSIGKDWFNRFIGVDLSIEEMSRCLDLLGFDPQIVNKESIDVTVPKFRQDIQIKEDLAEEIIRIYGYNRIPNTMMETSNFVEEPNQEYIEKNKIKKIMIGFGGYEILTYSFVSPKEIGHLNYSRDDERSKPVTIINPLGEDNSVMRTSLLPGMLDALAKNYNRKNGSNLMFEIGGIYLGDKHQEQGLPGQFEKICFGQYMTDFYAMKSVIEALFESLKIGTASYARSKETSLHPGRSADVSINGEKIGYIGQLHPRIAKLYDLCEETYVGEFNLQTIIKRSLDVNVQAEPLAKYPAMQRDLALVCDDEIMAGSIKELITASAGEFLISCEAFDVYKNENQIGKGKQSIAFALVFRSDTETLTDEQIDQSISNILEKLKNQDITLRA
ncbi:MAG: phenylalanine--tRNA ligase subunit beta [Anaerofustis sp.]